MSTNVQGGALWVLRGIVGAAPVSDQLYPSVHVQRYKVYVCISGFPIS